MTIDVEMNVLYSINDTLSALASELQVPFDSEDDEDAALSDLTHEIARRFRVGPYRLGKPTIPAATHHGPDRTDCGCECSQCRA